MKTIDSRKLFVMTISLVCGSMAGCFGSSGPETAEAYGHVTLNGEPVTSGRVLFFPVGTVGKEAGKPAQALIDSSGEFVLGTYEDDDGAVIGDHRVSVLSFPDPLSGIDPKSLGKPEPERVTVIAGESNEFHIKLTPHPEDSHPDEEEDD